MQTYSKRRPRFRVKIPVTQTIEYKIYLLKKELGKQEKTLQYQLLIFGEWKQITLEDYQECVRLQMNVRII